MLLSGMATFEGQYRAMEMTVKRFLFRVVMLAAMMTAVFVVIAVGMRSGGVSSGSQDAHGRTFFAQFVVAGGPIVWFVLLPMSLVMVYLAVQYFLTIRRKVLLPGGVGADVVELAGQLNPAELSEAISGEQDLVSTAVSKAVGRGGGDWFRMRDALFESLQEQSSALMRRIEWLNLIGNVSPMVGLFGTVFGMIKLFNAIVTAGGQPQPAQLADGIGVALVTTFWGLAIAIPALALYGVFSNRIETLANEAVAEAESIMPGIKRNLERQRREGEGERMRRIQAVEQRSARIKRESPLGQKG